MFARLTGIITDIQEHLVVLDVNGVGYLVYVGKTLAKILNQGEKKTLLIETIVREDQITLYGFDDEVYKKMFQILTKVQGVGNKIAMSILDVLTPSQIRHAILVEDETAFQGIAGIGKKLRARILQELKDIMQKMLDLPIGAIDKVMDIHALPNGDRRMPELLQALEKLGFQRYESSQAANKVLQKPENQSVSLEALLPQALLLLAKG